jgi:hypothetical protein
MKTEDILKKEKIELIYNHAIYFEEIEDTVYGVLAEDTNYMIQNIGKRDYPSISVTEIEENLTLLKDILK